MSDSTHRDTQFAANLLTLARGTLSEAMGVESATEVIDRRLEEPGACFVTLHKLGRLRGCIGSIRAYRSLREDLISNTLSAALSDPRFDPVRADELEDITVEVSILSPMRSVHVESEMELLESLRPGVDGLVLEHGGRRGTFLPSVWKQLRQPTEFLRRLKNKAGLAADFWSSDIRVWRYTTSSFSESELGRRGVATNK